MWRVANTFDVGQVGKRKGTGDAKQHEMARVKCAARPGGERV